MMMNFVAICLVVSSLAAAGVWSPSPAAVHNTNIKDDIIVKEGHRVVVVEYDQEGKRNTKVSISAAAPSDVEQKISSAASDALNNAKDKIEEAASVLPDPGKGLSGHGHRGPGPGELICDAYGKCKHKISSAIEKTKDKVSGLAPDAAATQKEMAYEAKDKVLETAHEVVAQKKEMAHDAKDFVQDAFGKSKETASEKAHGTKEAAKDAFGKAKETSSEKAHGAKEAAKETMEKAKGNIKEAKDLSKTIGDDVATNVSERVENARESIVEKVKEAKQSIEHAAKRVTTGLLNFFVSSSQFLHGFLRFLGFPETLNGLMGVLNLLGFATAYGMCVWVTFISSYVLAGALPRQQFGMVQSKIYPVYFRSMTCSIALDLLAHMPQLFSSKGGMFQGYNLLASILMVVTNSMYLEPRATKVMFERLKVEKDERRGRESVTGETSRPTEQGTAAEAAAASTTASTAQVATAATTAPENPEQVANIRIKMVRLSERLKKLNTYSSILNVLTLMSLTWHLVYLGQSLHMTTC